MIAPTLGPHSPFRDYIDHWLSTYVARLPAPSTRDGYARSMRLYWLPALGEKPIDELRASDIEAVLDDLKARGLKPSTVKTAFLVLSGAMTRAKADRYVTMNPVDHVRSPRQAVSECRWMSQDEAIRFIAGALVPDGVGSHYWYGPLIAAALMTGLRFGELRGLRWENVELWGEDALENGSQDAGNIHVCEQIYSRIKSVQFTPPKSASSTRDVPVTADLARILLAHRERVRRHAKRSGTRAWQDYGLVFPNKIGGPATPEVVTNTRAEVAKLVDIQPTPTMNALRHTYASLLIDGGTPPHVVAKLMGHADVQMTCNVYYSATPVARAAAAEALGGMFRRKNSYRSGA